MFTGRVFLYPPDARSLNVEEPCNPQVSPHKSAQRSACCCALYWGERMLSLPPNRARTTLVRARSKTPDFGLFWDIAARHPRLFKRQPRRFKLKNPGKSCIGALGALGDMLFQGPTRARTHVRARAGVNFAHTKVAEKPYRLFRQPRPFRSSGEFSNVQTRTNDTHKTWLRRSQSP